MTAAALLDSFARRGVILRKAGDLLAYDAPRGEMKPADMTLIRDRKPELLAHLAGRSTWPELAAMRWGPAVGDPEPGIVIAHPGTRGAASSTRPERGSRT